MMGLSLSSFALLVVQSVMSGLQRNLIIRAQQIEGIGTVHPWKPGISSEDLLALRESCVFYREKNLEVLLKHQGKLSAGILHGVEHFAQTPSFQHRDTSGVILGIIMAQNLKVDYGANVQIISPAHKNLFLGEVPRVVTAKTTDFLVADAPELDAFHLWSRIGLVHNLIGNTTYSGLRIFAPCNMQKLTTWVQKHDLKYTSWEESHPSLVWSLNLEKKVMIFLFVAMCFLIAIAISSGLLIFYHYTKREMITFWVLGQEEQKIKRATLLFSFFISLFSVCLGLILATGVLLILSFTSLSILPQIFVDRNIPVAFSGEIFGYAFTIPLAISFLVNYLTLKNLLKKSDFLASLKSF